MESQVARLLRIIANAERLDTSKLAVYQISRLTTPETIELVYRKLLRLTRHKNWNVRQMTAFAVSLTAQHLPPIRAHPQSCKRLSTLRLYDLAPRPHLLAETVDAAIPSKITEADEDIYGVLQTLKEQLLDPVWENRQGAGLVLRHLVPAVEDVAWIEDLVCLAIEGLIRDRFVDYASDIPIYPTMATYEEIIIASAPYLDIDLLINVLIRCIEFSPIGPLLPLRRLPVPMDCVGSIIPLLTGSEDVVTLAVEVLSQLESLPEEVYGQLAELLQKWDDISPSVIFILRALSKRPFSNKITILLKFLVHSNTDTRVLTLNLIESGLTHAEESIFCMLIQGAIMENDTSMIKRYIKCLQHMYKIDPITTQKFMMNELEQWLDFSIQENPRDYSFFQLPVTDSTPDIVYAFANAQNNEEIPLQDLYDRAMFKRMWALGKICAVLELPMQEAICPHITIIWIVANVIRQSEKITEILLKFECQSQLMLCRVRAVASWALIHRAWHEDATLPERLTPLFQALVTSYKSERIAFLRGKVSKSAARLTQLGLARVPCANDKFIANMLSSYEFSPLVADLAHVHGIDLFKNLKIFADLESSALTDATQLNLLEQVILASQNAEIQAKLLSLYPKLLHPRQDIQAAINKCLVAFSQRNAGGILSNWDYSLIESNTSIGTANAILILFEKGDPEICVQYAAAFVVPVLRQLMVSSRQLQGFLNRLLGILLKFVSLDQQEAVETALQERKEAGLQFVSSLSGYQIQPYEPQIQLRLPLRGYQSDGVSWLRFLYSYNLGGMLCDDMGLGKTVQTLCALGEGHRENPEAISLIMCSGTLRMHWILEAQNHFENFPIYKYASKNPLTPGVWVIAYEVVKKDIEKLRQTQYLYWVLDEGHIIKNPKSVLYKSVTQLIARNRLILSGTPLQNSILDIWSLFNFVMPGLLGSEQDFSRRYKSALAPKNSLSAFENREIVFKDESQALVLLNELHKIALPFILRRMKNDVLTELPAKVIQDYPIKLSQLQAKLNAEYKKKSAMSDILYQTKLLNHPAMVSPDITYTLEDAPKMKAIKEILETGEISTENGANHKALIFSKWTATLNYIENDVLRQFFPRTGFLRLDGKVRESKRVPMALQFNTDDDIRVMLSTTEVGGQGISLIGADVVIFVDHEFNPVKDLQAMDRTHRLGQNRVVTVYRLITTGTVEQSILGLQAFKWKIAMEIISKTNHIDNVDTAAIASRLAQEQELHPDEEEWNLN